MRQTFKNILIISLNIIVGIAIALVFAYLIFGTDTLYMGDKMPPVDIVGFYKQFLLNVAIQFFVLLIPITAVALPQTIVLIRKKVFTTKSDIFVAALLWILPLIVCFYKLSFQYGYTY